MVKNKYHSKERKVIREILTARTSKNKLSVVIHYGFAINALPLSLSDYAYPLIRKMSKRERAHTFSCSVSIQFSAPTSGILIAWSDFFNIGSSLHIVVYEALM